jgi:hypothetical protein
MLKMKRIVLLSLLIFPILLFAQYPTFTNKQKLGVQTTGDGLIYRGNEQTPTYIPNNVNNAYFYLDTVRNTLKFYKTNQWFTIYPTASDTISLGAYLLKSDTLAMLLPYLRKSDTISLSNRINNKLNATDTVSLSNRINLKLNKTDTINLSNRIDLKLNPTDTISLSNRINIKLNPSDTVSLSNRINTKLNSNDTISLSNRINKKLDTLYVNYQTNVDLLTNKDTINITTLEAGAGINIVNNVISLDTVLLDSVVRVQNVYVKNGTGTVLNKGEAVYVTGAAGTNILVGRASNVAESTSSKTLGLTMTSIGVNGFGYVIKEGLLKGLNTNSATAGDPIWLGIDGGLLFGLVYKPFAPKHLVYLGVVTDKNPSVGEVYVTVQNGFEIKELHDVQITSPSDKASLYYKSSEGLWRDTTATLLVSDTTSMLSKYVNTYGNQTNINGDKTFNNVITIDSATVTGKLLVNTTISDAVKINSNTNSTNLELANSSGSSVYIKSSNKNMILQTDTTALVYLNGDNKKVGILTMTPQQALQVAGNVRIDSLNNNLVPSRIIGSNNNNDLTNVNLGQGLSFSNDTLKVDLTIIDTAIAASSITLAGHVTGTGSTNSTVNTTISNGVVTNDMLAGSISDTKLNTITTAGKVNNTATTATASNTASTIVLRDANKDFSARNITATNFYGNATTSTSSYGLINSINISETLKFKSTNPPNTLGIINMTTPGTDFSIARIDAPQTFTGTQTFSSTISGNIDGNASTVTSITPSNFASQTANTVLAAPNGSNGTPTFRSLVSADIPNLNYLPLTGGLLNKLSNTNNFTDSILKISYNPPSFATNQNITGLSININNRGYTTTGITSEASTVLNNAIGVRGKATQSDVNGTGVAYGIIGEAAASGSGTNGSTYAGYFNNTSTVSGNHYGLFVNTASGGDYGIYQTGTGINYFGSNSTFAGNITANSFVKSLGTSSQFLKADGSVDANTYLTTGTAAYLPLAGGIMSGTIRRQDANYNESPNTFYFNMLNYYARRDNIQNLGQTAQITFTDRPGTFFYGPAVRTSDIYLMTAHNWNGSAYGQYLDTTLSVVANQDGGRIGISNLNPAYKLDVNGTLGVSGVTTLSNLIGGTTRMVTASTTGVLSTATIPTGTLVGTDTISLSNRINNKVSLNGDETINGTKSFQNQVNVLNRMTLSGSVSGLNRLLGKNTDGNGVGDITVGTGLNLSSNILTATGGSGTVTNVTAGSPANGLTVATGTTTPVISMALAASGTIGVVSATTQTFSGNKTFSDNIVVNNIKFGRGLDNTVLDNLGIGVNTLNSSNDISLANLAIGYNSLQSLTGGRWNTFVGNYSGVNMVSGSLNTSLGVSSLGSLVNGSHNTAIGESAAELTTGSRNTAVGSQSMLTLTSGANNTVIGYNSNTSSATATDQIVIGSDVTGQSNSTVTIGNSSGKIYNNYTTNATWIQTSDGRLKNVISKDSLGLSFINRLNPITYTWKPSNQLPVDNPYYNVINNKDTTTVIHGFVAQEIKAALDAENCSTFNGWMKGDDGIEGISREMFINPLVKAIQELSAQIEILKAEIKELKK